MSHGHASSSQASSSRSGSPAPPSSPDGSDHDDIYPTLRRAQDLQPPVRRGNSSSIPHSESESGESDSDSDISSNIFVSRERVTQNRPTDQHRWTDTDLATLRRERYEAEAVRELYMVTNELGPTDEELMDAPVESDVDELPHFGSINTTRADAEGDLLSQSQIYEMHVPTSAFADAERYARLHGIDPFDDVDSDYQPDSDEERPMTPLREMSPESDDEHGDAGGDDPIANMWDANMWDELRLRTADALLGLFAELIAAASSDHERAALLAQARNAIEAAEVHPHPGVQELADAMIALAGDADEYEHYMGF